LQASKTLVGTLETLDYDSHILVLGVIAATYGGGCPNTPVRGWGSEMRTEALRIGADQYRINRTRMEVDGKIVGGVLIHVVKDHYTGKPSGIRRVFIPWSSLENVRWTVEGVELSAV
jgi:hypothetical protein